MLIFSLAHKFALSFVTLNVTESMSSLDPGLHFVDGVGTLIAIVNTVVEPDVASHTRTLGHNFGSNGIHTLDETLNGPLITKSPPHLRILSQSLVVHSQTVTVTAFALVKTTRNCPHCELEWVHSAGGQS